MKREDIIEGLTRVIVRHQSIDYDNLSERAKTAWQNDIEAGIAWLEKQGVRLESYQGKQR